MRVVVAEDNALLRDGLTRILQAFDFEVVEAVDNAPMLDSALARDDVDVAVVDVRLPPTFTDEGLRAAIAARATRPGQPILVLSQFVEHLYAAELLASGQGGIGYLLKDRVGDVSAFITAVRTVAGGGTALDPEVVSSVLAAQRGGGPLERLSPREREVLALMAEGRSNAAVAEALTITEKAVTKHSASIFAKLDLPVSADDNRRVLAVLAWLGV
ncbi:LuxR C-terminal-related transcriptional regulator [Kribbia dieselivorans]|uniref:LuxR C-terminal-related transcriptional regulator n=1 Tax=Kribbia dieselivorans TaxID=331526 RepID=UPI0008382CA9|nr:response regulator transcription factor [Kribbia dieselivorans]